MNRTIQFAGWVAILLIAGAIPAAAGSGACVTAVLDAPFRLPDGQTYPAGPLTLCADGAFSPVDTVQRILVGGSTVGLFRSSQRRAEIGSIDSPQVVFDRDAEGTLNLVGYAVTLAGRTTAYRMRGVGGALRPAAPIQPSGGGEPAPAASAYVASSRAR
jgi:hypothetical protein